MTTDIPSDEEPLALKSNEGLGACTPVRGLTYRKGDRVANVHDVVGETVYWATYTDGHKSPDGMYRSTAAEWQAMADKAAAHGAKAFTLIRA